MKSKTARTPKKAPLAQALTRMAAAVKKFDVGSVSNAELAWVTVGAGTQD